MEWGFEGKVRFPLCASMGCSGIFRRLAKYGGGGFAGEGADVIARIFLCCREAAEWSVLCMIN